MGRGGEGGDRTLLGVDAPDELARELLDHCDVSLAGYKRPRSIDFTDAMPRDPNGKLYKRMLRDPTGPGATGGSDDRSRPPRGVGTLRRSEAGPNDP